MGPDQKQIEHSSIVVMTTYIPLESPIFNSFSHIFYSGMHLLSLID